jgi:hypothetical protein
LRTRRTRLADAGRSAAENVWPKDDVLSLFAKSVDEFPAKSVDLGVEDPACV